MTEYEWPTSDQTKEDYEAQEKKPTAPAEPANVETPPEKPPA